ncbi:MAG: class I SAM-dependent methyltransferase [Clostridium chrysemydis]|uniref:class I SAM-dependent methyltransferase n=1 Tax=Clostridium chrysemydis TaxID=2665504 RepID=UPI003F2CA087
MSKLINNHLRDGYSNYNLLFLKRYVDELSLEDKILDVGCGHFRNLYLFHQIGFKNLYGIDRLLPDPSEKPIDFKVNFIQKDITTGIPYPNSSFEIVLCNFVLMFIPLKCLKTTLYDILSVCKGFCVIETQKPFYEAKNGQIEPYDFKYIIELIETHPEFEIVDKKVYKEKLIARRITNG